MRHDLTGHAKIVLEKRQIPLEWVEAVLRNPQEVEADDVDPTLKHFLREIPVFGNRVLRVVANESVDPPRIVTVYFDRRKRRL
jgi:hypothetical protein